MEKEFLDFLKSKNLSEKTIKMYLRVLKKDIPKKLREEEEFIDIFECNNIGFLKNLYQRLCKGGALYAFNRKTSHNTPSAALKNFIEFLGKGKK